MDGIIAALKCCARFQRRRVAIGVVRSTPKLEASLKEGREVADILVVGQEVPGFEFIERPDDASRAQCLVQLVADGTVEAIVRGQVYFTDYHESIKRRFGFRRDLMCPMLLRDLHKNEWFLTPVTHHDDASIQGRCYLAAQAAQICEKLGVEARIAILASDNERGYLTSVDRSLDEAEEIVSILRTRGFHHCEIYPLRIDLAAFECNIVVPMDGTVGNFVCRSLTYLGGAYQVGGFSLTTRFVSIDTSRSSDQFGIAIEAAVAMKNIGGMPISEHAME